MPDHALGLSRGGLTTKIHLAVRRLGCPVRFTLTAGQKGDAPQAETLIRDLPADIVLADAAYRAGSVCLHSLDGFVSELSAGFTPLREAAG